MSVYADVAQGISPQALVEMFVFDPTNLNSAWTDKILRWHPGTTVAGATVRWQGLDYQPFPVEATGFEQTASGRLPRPTLRASNIGGQLGAFIRSLDGALGAKVLRKRVYGKYLDAANFPGGNPNADPSAGFEDEIFYLARKANENPIFCEFELAAPFDVAGIMLPRRQVVAGTCQWIYRDPLTCAYAGGPILNDPVFPGIDRCGKTLTACKLRFGQNGNLPTSAFPSSLLAKSI
jgi:lambda family phage minor tail protein L